jgi:hypothetical protein
LSKEESKLWTEPEWYVVELTEKELAGKKPELQDFFDSVQ